MPRIIKIDRAFLPLFRDMVPSEYDPDDRNEYLLGALNDDGFACGVLWYRFDSISYDILFLGVHPMYRRKGIGTFLIKGFLDSIIKSNLIFSVKASFEDIPENAEFRRLMTSLGSFKVRFDSFIYLISKDTRISSALLTRLDRKNVKTYDYFDIPSNKRATFESGLKRKNFYYIADIDEEGSGYIKNMCICALDNMGVSAAVFFKAVDKETIELSFAYGATRDLTAILKTFTSAIHRIKETPYDECELRINAVNDSVKKLTEFIFGDNADRIPVYVAEWNYF